MYKNILIIILLFLVIFAIIKLTEMEHHKEDFAVPTNHERPFVNVFGYDSENNIKEQLNIVLLSHPFTRDSSWEQYNEYLRDKFLILGITSYSEFPKITSNKLDGLHNPEDKAWKYDYMNVVKGWLHCFREPHRFIDEGIRKMLLSESDFCDSEYYKPDRSIKKIYDFIYLCPKDSDTDPIKKKDCFGWVATNKNWKLALKCLPILCGKYKLKGLLVGRKDCDLPIECKNLIETTNFISKDELLKKYRQSRFLFIPNKVDASPRVLTEALCTGLPILVNSNILGGWKYVNDNTGAFFGNKHDISSGIEYILNNYTNLNPRENFINNFGKEKTGKEFKNFIEENYKEELKDLNIEVSKYDYLYL